LAIPGGTPIVAAFFTVQHGAGNGLNTIAKGTLSLALFGPGGYGARLGLLAVSHRLATAAGPFVFALVLDGYGALVAIGLSATLSLVALAALLRIGRAGCSCPGPSHKHHRNTRFALSSRLSIFGIM
jgi:hypothetical protein